ncbi:MAG TPA: hypothetical protein VMF56_04560 [Acidobacteriaceae bacterium]|nr:hypothetical protein [Acidobacteriaceae bacterium]
MMQNCADRAVKIAHDRFGFQLDYSEESLQSLETILASVGTDLNLLENDHQVPPAIPIATDHLAQIAAQYPGGVAAVPTLLISGSQLYPLMKVYRRLTMGDRENIWEFYQRIRNHLSTVHPLDGSRDAADTQ